MNRSGICHEPVSGAVFVFTYSFIGWRVYQWLSFRISGILSGGICTAGIACAGISGRLVIRVGQGIHGYGRYITVHMDGAQAGGHVSRDRIRRIIGGAFCRLRPLDVCLGDPQLFRAELAGQLAGFCTDGYSYMHITVIRGCGSCLKDLCCHHAASRIAVT